MRQTYVHRASPSLPIYFDNFAFLSQVLRLVPDDNDARQTKLFLLLQTERYSDALALLGAANQSSVFERAYSSYRLQHLDEAARLLNGIKERRGQDRGALHLEAQLVRSTSALEAQSEFVFFGRTTDRAIIRLPLTYITSSSTPLTR
jgi:hypothetical protein